MKTLLVAAGLLLATAAHAVLPSEMMADPAQEARAREISKELRCVVCQNQSIDDSDAPLAKDLRLVVREQIRLGRSNPQIIAYVSDRYGDFVLLRPPLRPSTWLLWAGPFLFLLAGAVGLAVWRRPDANSASASPALDAPLTAEETKAIAVLSDRNV